MFRINFAKRFKGSIVFFVFLAFSIIYVIYSVQAANKQNMAFDADENAFQNGISMMRQSQYTDAVPYFQKVLEDQPNSYLVILNYSKTLLKLGRYHEARVYLEKAREQRPYLVVSTPMYLFDYGKVLYELGEYKEAKKYLLLGQKYSGNLAVSDSYAPILRDLDEKLKGTGDKNGQK